GRGCRAASPGWYRVFAANRSLNQVHLAPEGSAGPGGPHSGDGGTKGHWVATAGDRSRVLVGRDGELAELDRGLERLGAGKPWFVQIVGEPGIGKSPLPPEPARGGRGADHPGLAG